MKFKVDENLPREIAELLRSLGYSADTVEDEGLRGATDPLVVDAARKENRILLTLDKGLGNLVAYPAGTHAGVVLFRPPASGPRSAAAFGKLNLPRVLDLSLSGRVVIVTETKVRVR